MAEPREVEHTLALARAGLAPSAGERQRLLDALALVPTPHGGPAEGARNSAKPSTGWGALKASGKAGLFSGLLLVGAGFAGGYWTGHRASLPPHDAPITRTEATATPAPIVSQPASPVHSGTGLAQAKASPAGGSEPMMAAQPVTDVKKAARHRNTTEPQRGESTPADAFTQEMLLLQRVERALRNEDPALVLSLLGDLDARHPQGVLSEERRAARVMAHCQANEPNARAAAQRFLLATPKSVYTDRVRAVCRLN